MIVKLIVAMDLERGIGKNNDLMWHLPADMKFFKETTTGHVVVMGRKNWDSIPERFRPLPNRENVVLTRNTDFSADGAKVFHSLEDCLSFYNGEDQTVFIIGGGEIYRLALELECVDEMMITHVNAVYGADTFFPEFDENNWTIHEVLNWEKDEKNEAPFTIKRYLKK
ncbi:MAG: dihydrofolate reductase [Bacteroidetes bacterium]|nr:MAG: dihydrofolate reductase [Bacteroidota bacterium]